MMFRTRRICVEDVPRMVELLEYLHSRSRHSFLTFDAPKMVSLLSAAAFADDMICLVCVDASDRIIGGIGGITTQPGFARETLAYKQFFVLDPEVRGYAQARILLNAFEAWACTRSASRCHLFIDYGNEDARVAQFCKRLGYVQQGIGLVKEIGR